MMSINSYAVAVDVVAVAVDVVVVAIDVAVAVDVLVARIISTCFSKHYCCC